MNPGKFIHFMGCAAAAVLICAAIAFVDWKVSRFENDVTYLAFARQIFDISSRGGELPPADPASAIQVFSTEQKGPKDEVFSWNGTQFDYLKATKKGSLRIFIHPPYRGFLGASQRMQWLYFGATLAILFGCLHLSLSRNRFLGAFPKMRLKRKTVSVLRDARNTLEEFSDVLKKLIGDASEISTAGTKLKNYFVHVNSELLGVYKSIVQMRKAQGSASSIQSKVFKQLKEIEKTSVYFGEEGKEVSGKAQSVILAFKNIETQNAELKKNLIEVSARIEPLFEQSNEIQERFKEFSAHSAEIDKTVVEAFENISKRSA